MKENKKDLEDLERAGRGLLAPRKPTVGKLRFRETRALGLRRRRKSRLDGKDLHRQEGRSRCPVGRERDRISTRLLYAAGAVDRFAKEGAATRVQLERLARERPHPPTTLHTANDTP